MIEYLVRVLIYFIIFMAVKYVFREQMLRYDTMKNSTTTKAKALLSTLAISCIPFLRFWVVVMVVLLAVAPDDFVNQVNEKAKGNQTEDNNDSC